MDKIFISHCSEMDQIADKIAQSLETEGIPCWIDHRDTASGENYMNIISDVIDKECFGIIFLIEEHAIRSPQIEREVSLASAQLSSGFKVYSVYLENVEIPPNMKYLFASIQEDNRPDARYPWSEFSAEQMTKLADTILRDYTELKNKNSFLSVGNQSDIHKGIEGFCEVWMQSRYGHLIVPNVREFDNWFGAEGDLAFRESVQELWKREDWNCLYIGKGGSGKTSCLNQFMKEFMKEYPDRLIFYVDAEKCLPYGADGIVRYIEKNYICRFHLAVPLWQLKEILYDYHGESKEPEIVLMLDGLSDCIGKNCGMLQEELDRLRLNKKLQILMTSSEVNQPFFIGDAAVQRFQIQRLTKKQIDDYLEANNCRPENNRAIPYEIVSNPLMLTIYANTNEFIRQGGNTSYDFREEILSNADVLWNYMGMQNARYVEKNSEKEKIKKEFLFRFVIPYVAACIEVNSTTSDKALEDMNVYIILGRTGMITQKEFYKCVEKAAGLLQNDAFCDVFSEFDWDMGEISFGKEECRRILEEDLLQAMGIFIKNEYGRYCFSSTILCKFLAAVHFYNYLKVCNSVRRLAVELEVSQLGKEVLVYLGELCGEYKNRPYRDSKGTWRFPGMPTEITKALNRCRGQYQEGVKKTVANLIQVMKEERENDLSGQDLSRLDLRRVTFTHVICSRKNEDGFLAARFDGSMIDRWIFQKVGYSKDISSIRFWDSGKKLFFAVEGSILLVDVKSGECIRSYDTGGVHVQSIDISPDRKHLLAASLDRGITEWNIETKEETVRAEHESDIFIRQAIYLDEYRILYVTKDRILYVYNKEKKERKKLADVNANGLAAFHHMLIIPSRSRDIYEFDFEDDSLEAKYSCNGVADSYITKAWFYEFEQVVIGCTKDGYLLEWEKEESIPVRYCKAAGEINDFIMDPGGENIYCATGTDGIFRIHRGNSLVEKDDFPIEKIDLPISGCWSAIDLYEEKLLAAESLEGKVIVKNLETKECRIIAESDKTYELPYLYLEGCSFKRVNLETKLDEHLLEILRRQNAIV